MEIVVNVYQKLSNLGCCNEFLTRKEEQFNKIQSDFDRVMRGPYADNATVQRVRLACFIRQVIDAIAPGQIITETWDEYSEKDNPPYPIAVIAAVHKSTKRTIAEWKVDLNSPEAPELISAADIIAKISEELDKI